jgi:hypothetical protein
MSNFKKFYYGYAVIVLPILSLLQDGYLHGRLAWGLTIGLISIFATLALEEKKDSTWFYFFWITGLAVQILVPFTWAGGYDIPWTISTSLLLLLTFLNLGHQDAKNQTSAQFFAAVALFFWLVGLSADSFTPAYRGYAAVLYLYLPIGGFYVLQSSKVNLQHVLRWTLMAITLVLVARRWTHHSTTPWILIVQPLIGLCSVQWVCYIRG